MNPSRGVRNKNPGNIDYNPRNQWQGQIGIEPKVGSNTPRFALFDSAENGIRALAKLLLNYRGKDGMPGVGLFGIDTPIEFINRWAPSGENNTSAYVQAVADAIGVQPHQSIDITRPAVLLALVTAIIGHENGYQPYSPSVVAEGVRRALS